MGEVDYPAMKSVLLSFIFLLIAVPASAQSVMQVSPTLASNESREFLTQQETRSEETVLLAQRGAELLLEYSADAPIDLWMSFPIEQEGTQNIRTNPLHALKMESLHAGEHVTVLIDLTLSPAWSPSRESYLLHVRGVPGSVISIHHVAFIPANALKLFQAFIRELFVKEPTILSTINFLRGYKVFDTSMTVVLGALFFIGAGIALFLAKKRVSMFLVCLIFLLLYDARFSIDLLRIHAADVSQWQEKGEYRQLGPIHEIAAFLKEERRSIGDAMSVAICFDGTDYLQKQLRYLMYPTPVRQAKDNFEEATHLVIVDTKRGLLQNGNAACGEDLQRPALLLSTFLYNSSVLLFLPES
jgi:hypothetical protein